MCGIVGYVGTEQAAPILLAGLSKLEYRGYDSAGIAIRNEDTGDITVVKAKGRLKILSEKTNEGHAVPGTCGIGHTRWATHGEPSENNAHPHCTDDKSVVLVHNGIIENYQELKDKLIKSGYAFYSQTDTEIIGRQGLRWRRFPEQCCESEDLMLLGLCSMIIRGRYLQQEKTVR